MDDSEMLETIFDMLGRGTLYFDQAHRLCRASANDSQGYAAEAVLRFAKLGAGGKHSQNIERDAYRWLNSMLRIKTEPANIVLRLQNPWEIGAKFEEVPVLSIHEMFSALYHAGPIQQTVSLWGQSGRYGIRNFWAQAMQKLEWARKHPGTQNKTMDELAKILPIVFFIDGVEIFKNNEYVIWCTGAGKQQQYLFTIRMFVLFQLYLSSVYVVGPQHPKTNNNRVCVGPQHLAWVNPATLSGVDRFPIE
jgi:hypothetical protein